VPTFFQVKSFIAYWLACVDENSLHSPFFYDFYTQVIKRKSKYSTLPENLRQQLLQSSQSITIEELGAGSVLTNPLRKVADIARVSLSDQKFSQLYARSIQHFNSKHIVELGTSLGVNTLYLAQHPSTIVATFEGAMTVAEIARDTFAFADSHNITLYEGNIDFTLEKYLRTHSKIDWAFIDANHRYEAVITYFNLLLSASHANTVLVFDDIHLNEGMHKAWKEIQKHDLVYATADLYRCGFVFLDPSLNRQHCVLWF
jgi:predicted O-methyltransferase YrrM